MNRSLIAFLVLVSMGILSCKEQSMPKPHGYLRIHVPENIDYTPLKRDLQCRFEYSEHAQINMVAQAADSFWLDIVYPDLNGRIYLSYKSLYDADLNMLVEDARKFVFKHSVKASGIEESVIRDEKRKMYGILYDIDGDAASNTQFFLTDSTQHFLRAALYFQCTPNRDSLDPVINHVREDILHLLETFEWEN